MSSRKRILGVLTVLALAVSWNVSSATENGAESLPITTDRCGELGVQRCLTECQDTFTNCIQRCDGNRRCEKKCPPRVKKCVAKCRAAERDAGAAPSPSR